MDTELIGRFGCTVHAFDPDPKSVAWVSAQHTPANFLFQAEGLSDYDGMQRFYHAFREDKVNSSTVKKNKTFDDLPVKRLRTFMRERHHDHIDLLKMDIEGSEYNVLPDIVDLDVSQILVEIHQRFFTGWKGLKRLYGRAKTKQLLQKLGQSGFEIVHKHDIGDGSHDCDYLFMKRS